MEFNRRKNRLRFLISLGVSLTIFIAVIWQMDFPKIREDLAHINPFIFALFLLVSVFTNVVLYSDRWRWMLRFLDLRHSLWQIIRVHLGTGVLHLLFPIQTGEAITGYALARKGRGSVSVYMSTIVYGKYLNLVAVTSILLVGLALAPGLAKHLTWGATAAFIAMLAVGSSFEIHPLREWLIRRFHFLGPRFEGLIRGLFTTYSDVSLGKKFLLLLYSIFFQMVEVVYVFVLFHVIGIDAPFPTMMAIIALVILGASLPLTIAGAGTREALCLLLLTPYTDTTTAVAAGVAYTVTQYIWPMLVGLPWMRPVIAETFLYEKESSEPFAKIE